MSQASRILKSIAASAEYKTLEEALKTYDYEGVYRSYLHVCDLLEKTIMEVFERIQRLSRKNKGEDYHRFRCAIFLRTYTIIPDWHRLNSLIKKEGVIEGQVIGFGRKGDPLVRTPEGRTVILPHCSLIQRQQVKFKVLSETRNVDFGQVVELNSDYLYQIVKKEIQLKIRTSLDAVRKQLTYQTDFSKDGLAGLSCLLTELEGARELVLKLRPADRERVIAVVLAYRRRLLIEHGVGLIFDFLSQKEEKEIREFYQDNGERIDLALAAPGLLNHGAHQALKENLFAGEELRKCAEIRQILKNKPYDIEIAMELMELRLKTQKAYPLAKEYVIRMDTFFARLRRGARKVALSMAEERIFSVSDIQATIEKAFSDVVISAEFRKNFTSAEELCSLRSGLVEIKTILNGSTNSSAESHLQKYLNHRIAKKYDNC